MASKEAMQAEKLYREGMAPAEIAKMLDKPLATISSWKRRHGWDVQEGATPATQRKRNVAPKPQCKPPTPSLDEQLVDAVEENTDLTDAQKVFCLHYSRTFNATASYRKAYPECAYTSAMSEGSRLSRNPKIRAEITRLKKIRQLDMMASGDDVVERMMQIAFADITDYIEWGQYEVQVMAMFGPVYDKDEETGEKTPVTKIVNDVRFVDSALVDGTLVSEVKKGKDGASIKLPDRMRALEWLAGYFELNPKDSHRAAYDNKKLALQEKALALQEARWNVDASLDIEDLQPLAEMLKK